MSQVDICRMQYLIKGTNSVFKIWLLNGEISIIKIEVKLHWELDRVKEMIMLSKISLLFEYLSKVYKIDSV